MGASRAGASRYLDRAVGQVPGSGMNLSASKRDEAIAEGYRAGQTLRELGEKYGLSHARVGQILDAVGVPRRKAIAGPGAKQNLPRCVVCENPTRHPPYCAEHRPVAEPPTFNKQTGRRRRRYAPTPEVKVTKPRARMVAAKICPRCRHVFTALTVCSRCACDGVEVKLQPYRDRHYGWGHEASPYRVAL